MTSKIRLLVDGTRCVYVQCYFLLLTPPAFALLAPLKPQDGARDYAFQLSKNRISRLPIGLTTLSQILAKKRSISLLMVLSAANRLITRGCFLQIAVNLTAICADTAHVGADSKKPRSPKVRVVTPCTVLVVADQMTDCLLFKKILTTHGYEVSLAQTGAEACEMFGRDFDLILIDIVLSDLSGLDLLEILFSQKLRAIPIVVSGDESNLSGIKALTMGAFAYLKKPINNQELLEVLNRAKSMLMATKSVKTLAQSLEMLLETLRYQKDSDPEVLIASSRALRESESGTKVSDLTVASGSKPRKSSQKCLSLREVEKQTIIKSLLLCGGNKAQAARMLGISEKSIYNKISRLGIPQLTAIQCAEYKNSRRNR